MSDTPKGDRRKAVIDENLRRVYQEVDSEQIPDRFTDLLKQLRERDAGKEGGNAEG